MARAAYLTLFFANAIVAALTREFGKSTCVCVLAVCSALLP